MLKLFRQTGLRWTWLALIALVLDQVTKHWVVAEFSLFESRNLLPFFNLTYVHNYGAAFSFLSDAGGWQRWFFTAIALVVSMMVIYWMKTSRKEQTLFSMALALILGGALGNLYDRLMYGYVIDFLDFYYQGWHWPAFNIADSAIFLGASFLIIDAFKNPESKQPVSEGK